jgi:hypothetical protein
VDPGEKGAILEAGGPGPPEGGNSWQLASDSGGEETWPKTWETGSPHLQETFMHRVSAIVHCISVVRYNHNRNRVSLSYLFQENKSFGTNHHLHSSSDVQEVVSSTIYFLYATNPKRSTDNEMRMTTYPR